MRIIFMGTPEFSVPTLQALHGAGHEIVGVWSQPPRPAGRRGLELRKSPVHEAAETLGLKVHTPASMKTPEAQATFAALDADVAVVVAFGQILPLAVLDAPRLGCFNGHASLLPRWRGAAPIQRAIMAGDRQTGMMVMNMDAGLDTGDVAMTAIVDIGADMTAGQLHDELSDVGAKLMVEAMAALEAGTLTLTPQPQQGVTYATKIDKAEARLDLTGRRQDVHNIIRGLSPFPGAWCEMQFGGTWERVKLLGSTLAQGADGLALPCADGSVTVTSLQRAGGKVMDAKTFLRGAKPEGIR